MEELTQACLADEDFEDAASIKRHLIDAMIHHVGKDPATAQDRDWFYALAYVVRAVLSVRNIKTVRDYGERDVKRAYYLSMEYLPGRSLMKSLIDLGVEEVVADALGELGLSLERIDAFEFDAALGNGGLGRLAACFMDSLATQEYPSMGYGIRYEYGMFTQGIEKGRQVEHPENWLRYGNPWEIERPSVIYPVRFKGRIVCFKNEKGEQECQWVDAEEVVAMAFDVPVSGFDSGTVGNLRLWASRSSRDFDLGYFNEGNYIEAVRHKTVSENLSKVLYPNDKTQLGQELRLMQEYFFVSASLQDICARHIRDHGSLESLSERVVMQLNDTHPALSVPELMRILIDVHHWDFDDAWRMTRETFCYTNHTLLPEALETWSIDMLGRILPRHLELIFQINDRFLRQVRRMLPGDPSVLRRVSLVDDDSHSIRMAHVAIVGSRKVNGVAALHSELLRTNMFPDFDKIYPGKFVNQTNGITPRRWLREANPELSALITEAIGGGWEKDLSKLQALVPLAEDAAFRDKFIAVKQVKRDALAAMVKGRIKSAVDPASMFDTQVKRIHEYKRQLLNVLHVITRYVRMRDDPDGDFVPRTVVFAGKAAPGYDQAKLIIRLINDVAEIVNNDPAVRGYLKVAFLPDYNVTRAQVIIPGSDLSEQISTAGTEASGTGNMKFALNGALTIGTLDGANVEIREEVGDDNIFIFGLTTEDAQDLRMSGYDPWSVYHGNEELRLVLDMIGNGYFSPEEPDRYKAIVDALLRHGDHFLLLADYQAYLDCQDRVDDLFRDPAAWARKAILNVANMGKFSSDRTIHGYASEIWGVKQVRT